MDIVANVVTVADAVVVATDEVIIDDPLDTVVAVGGTDASSGISVKILHRACSTWNALDGRNSNKFWKVF